jgi:hypothetical protein
MADDLENCQDPAFRLIFVIQQSEVHKENHNRIRSIKVVACIIYGNSDTTRNPPYRNASGGEHVNS